MVNNNESVIIAMLEEIITNTKNSKSQQLDLSKQVDIEKVEKLSNQMQTYISQIDEVVEQARQPIIKENRFVLDIVSNGTFYLFIGVIIIVSALSASLYVYSRPNYDRKDNDLKYRYIKMKGETSAEQILELEDIFEINRDNAKINQMHKDVKQYEETIRKQAIAQEQARLRQLEAKQLIDKATILQKK